MQNAIEDLFARYEALTNAALAGAPDLAALCDLYADAFIESSPAGVMSGRKDEGFRQALAAGFARNRTIGAERMEIRDLRIEPIDATHALAHVAWRATYDVGGARKRIDFTNVYLVRIENGRAQAFGWITGDEEAVLREHGII